METTTLNIIGTALGFTSTILIIGFNMIDIWTLGSSNKGERS